MSNSQTGVLPPLSPEQRRVAAGQFERANQVIAKGDHDYGIRLLLSCCKLDPGNLSFRQSLRRTEKAKFRNNLRGAWMSGFSTWRTRTKIRSALKGRRWLKALELGEQVLLRNPWETSTELAMADAALELGLLDMAIWMVDQARQKNSLAVRVNRKLAQLFENRGNYVQAMALWNLVLQVNPADAEADQKTRDLAARDTIAKGNYEGAAVGGEAMVRPGMKTQETAENPEPSEEGAESKPAASAPAVDRVAKEAMNVRAKIVKDPTNPQGYLQLAGLYRRAGKYDQARQALQSGLGPTGNHFDIAMDILELEIEGLRRNLKIAEQKLREKPDSKELKKVHSQLNKEINSRELEMFRQRADRFPANMAFRFELGVRLYRAGQLDEAIRELQATRADPRHQSRSLMHLGICFAAHKNWRLAKRNFEEALQNMPASDTESRKELLFHLAQGSAEAGELAAAVEFAAELANMDYSYREIGRLLDEWQTRLQEAS